MLFRETSLNDAMLIEVEQRIDERGYFARTFCEAEFEKHGLIGRFSQSNQSGNARRGTLRGMHFQRAPHSEAKIVRCVRGAIYDVIVDVREGSPTYRQWEGFELTDMNGRMLYVPPGFAHGYQTLMDDVEVTYQVSHPYTPSAEAGLRYDDPTLGIDWPEPVTAISEKDSRWPLL